MCTYLQRTSDPAYRALTASNRGSRSIRPLKEIEAGEISAVIARWLYSLAKDDRVLFLRRYWFGESLISLAQECKTTANKLAGRIHRLRAKLKLALEMEDISL